MIKIKSKNKCCGCYACANICPKKCIEFYEDFEGFKYPKVNKNLCVNCHLCEKVCQYIKNENFERKKEPLAYAVKAKNEIIRYNSSSGGFFPLISKSVLNKNGIVYGVAMQNNQTKASTIRINNISQLSLLNGSKYIQADIDYIFLKVKQDLINGKMVLFSGVPCQIIALKNFLNKDYENLFCVEVICHGVPSPALWKKYLKFLQQENKSQVNYVNFRDKKNGWKNFGVSIHGENICQYSDLNNDPYMIMFLQNYCLRPSCYNCKAKKIETKADITIGDFWGIEKIIPEIDDDKGISLVLVNNSKGNFLIKDIKNEIISYKIPYILAIKGNAAYAKSVKKPIERNNFFKNMNKMNFQQLKKKYCKISKYNIFKIKLKKTLLYKIYKKCLKSN